MPRRAGIDWASLSAIQGSMGYKKSQPPCNADILPPRARLSSLPVLHTGRCALSDGSWAALVICSSNHAQMPYLQQLNAPSLLCIMARGASDSPAGGKHREAANGLFQKKIHDRTRQSVAVGWAIAGSRGCVSAGLRGARGHFPGVAVIWASQRRHG